MLFRLKAGPRIRIVRINGHILVNVDKSRPKIYSKKFGIVRISSNDHDDPRVGDAINRFHDDAPYDAFLIDTGQRLSCYER